MNIRLNNRDEEIPGDLISIAELLLYKNFTFRMLVIKVNGCLVRKEVYDTIKVMEGDDVMVLHLISGG